jgi:phenylacetate-CoA ligase
MARHPILVKQNGADAELRQKIRAFAPRLARTELLSPEELLTYRAPYVSKFLAHARETTAFYKGKFDFDLNAPDEIGRRWSQIPILTRAEAARSRESLISARIPEEDGPITKKETSGSTGMPLKYQSTFAFEIANCALTERMFRWWRVDGNKSFAQIVQSAASRSREGEHSRGWHSARPQGVKYSLYHGLDIDTQLDWLLARKPAYLASFAGILKELATTAKRRGAPLRFDMVLSVAATLDTETRELCRSVFGAEIADTYGAQEAGHIAAQCPDCGEYHTSADMAVIEILRDDGSPAASGEIGRVVVTPLHNYAMPLVRYELGDCAEVGTANPACGRKLPTLRRILGRYRNLFRFRDGTRIWPVATAFYLHDFVRFTQFQIVQMDFDSIEVRYVPEGGPGAAEGGTPGPGDLANLTERVRKVLKQPVQVTVRAVDKIERAATGKFEDCISLIPTVL